MHIRRKKNQPQTYNHHWSTQLYNKLSALTSQMKSQKSQSIRFLQLSPLSPFHTQSPLPHACLCKSGITSKIPTEGYFADPFSYNFCLVWCPDWCKSKLSKSVLGNQSQSSPPHAPTRAVHAWHKREGRLRHGTANARGLWCAKLLYTYIWKLVTHH